MKSYLPISEQQQKEMLQSMGKAALEDLFSDIPEQVRFRAPLEIEGYDERDLYRKMEALSKKNQDMPCFLGAGAYRHYIPSTVAHLANRAEFYTAYTPYQAEMSQGMLQAVFEYQSMICTLTGMDVSNASVYDGATACAEAMLMARDSKRKKVFTVSEGMHPDTMQVLQTYAHAAGIELRVCPLKDGKTDLESLAALCEGTSGLLFSNPNFYGCIEDVFALEEIARAKGALVIACVNPITLGVLAPPGDYADIAVGEGQPLGNPVSFGGPYLGFMAAKKKYMRNLPGRLVGESTDEKGRRGYLLTLQAREQHIRRDKATSNICSNQSLNALRAAIYLATLGPQGLEETARACFSNAHYAAERIAQLEGFELAYDAPFFYEVAIRSIKHSAKRINEMLLERGIIGGLDLSNMGQKDVLLFAFAETLGKEEIDALVAALQEVAA